MDHWTQPAGRARVPSGQPPVPQPPAPPPAGPPSAPPPAGPPSPPAGPPPAPPPIAPQQRPGDWSPPSSPPSPPNLFSPAPPPAVPVPSAPPGPAAGARRLAWPGVLALVLVMVLIVGLGVQSWLLFSVSSDLDKANQRLDELSQGQEYSGERLDALEDRAGALEDFAGGVFDPEAVASGVLPSVLMVAAGDFTGTAFAVGPETEDGGTNLFTNYHVVQAVWEGGGREVTLERTNQVYPAEIVDVAPEADLAWLRTESSFRGLSTSEEVAAGEQIVVVGAPRGLTDTVTTGVVSTPDRMLDDGSGPWIQFDAAVNPGNSGGPVIDSGQAVIGIATLKELEAEAIGYAVPISVACERFDICG